MRMCKTAALLASAAAIGMPLLAAKADLPAVLDRVPKEALVVAAVGNMDAFNGKVTRFAQATGLPIEADGLGLVGELLKMEGLNRTGSVAIAMLSAPREGGMSGEPDMVVLVPVSNYQGFIKAMGAEGTDGVVALKGNDMIPLTGGEEAFAKDIGGGYAAIAPKRSILEGFSGAPGNAAAHTATLGAVGARVGNASDTIIIANIQALGPALKEGVDGVKAQMEMAMMMAGGGNEGATQMVQMVMENFVRDASVGVVGIGLDDANVSLDIAAQFKEGSELAGFFNSTGKASGLLSRLPAQPFLFAMAMDTSAPGLRTILKNMAKMGEDAAKAEGGEALAGAGAWDSMLQNIDTIDGFSMQIGQTPALMGGGLFANAVTFMQTSKPDAYIDATREAMTQINGKTVGGVTYATDYKAGGAEISGVKVDSWRMGMTLDPNDPAAMQAQQMQMLMFGMGGGPAGYTAKVDGGVVTTLAQNTPLMTATLDSVKTGKGLGAADDVSTLAKKLPEGRTFEAFIGVKSILDTVGGLMAMMGGGPQMQFPDKIMPVALGGTTDKGGVQIRVVVPNDVIKTVSQVGQQLQGQMGGDGMGEPAQPAEGGAAPKY